MNALPQQQPIQYQQPMILYQGQLLPTAALPQLQNAPGFYNVAGPQPPSQPVYTALVPQQVQQAAVLPQNLPLSVMPPQQIPMQKTHQPKTKDAYKAGFATGFFKGLSKTLQDEFQDLMPVSEKKEGRSWKWGRGKASPTQEKTEAQMSTQQDPGPVPQKQSPAQDITSAGQTSHPKESVPDEIMTGAVGLAENGIKDELEKLKDDSPSQQETSAGTSSQNQSDLDAPAQPQYGIDSPDPQQQLPTADLSSVSPHGPDPLQGYPQQTIGSIPPPPADLSSQGPFSPNQPVQEESFTDTNQPQYDTSTPSTAMFPAWAGGNECTVDQNGDLAPYGEADTFDFNDGQDGMDGMNDMEVIDTQSGGGFMSLFS